MLMKFSRSTSKNGFQASLVLCLACLLLPAGTTYGQQVPYVPRHEYTNVILISLQCLRPDHLGLYGYKRQTSRNIDALARESVVFDNAIAQANLTPVAQMSVLTSQYPRVNGMISFEVGNDAVSQRTLPAILKYYDYTTAAVVSSPEFFLRYDTDAGTMVNPGDVFSRSFDSFSRTIRGPGGRSLRRIPKQALRWLSANRDRKFFLWIASGLNHMPYGAAVPSKYRTMYDPEGYTPFWQRLPGGEAWHDVNDDPNYDIFSRVFGDTFYWNFAPAHHLTPEDIEYVNGRYDAGVYYTDLFIGELMKLLESLKLKEKTLIILHSIHGEDLGDNGRFFHYDVNDTIVKNALLMRFPGQMPASARVEEQVQSIDIVPTVLDYLEIPVPHEAQGKTLLPFLKGETASPPDEYAFIDRIPWWEYTLHKWYLEFKSNTGAHFSAAELEKLKPYRELLKTRFDDLGYPPGDIAVRTNEWKLILRKNSKLLDTVSWKNFITGSKNSAAAIELYDLKNDPLETTNVADRHPETVLKLKTKLLEWDKSVKARKAEYRQGDKRLVIPYP